MFGLSQCGQRRLCLAYRYRARCGSPGGNLGRGRHVHRGRKAFTNTGPRLRRNGIPG